MATKESFMEKEKVTQCPLCKSDTSFLTNFETCESEGETLQYLICRRCGLVFQSPRLSQAALDVFYRESYRQLIQGSEEPIEKDLRVQYGRASHLLRFVDGALPKVRRCLDIGSSTGIVLKRFQENFGCEVQGVEPGDAYREHSQREGVAAVTALEDLDPGYRGSFDLVIMSHTLEHLPDPVTYLRDIRERWLSPKGYLLVEVPNLFGHQALEFSHLTAFSSSILQKILRQAGFRVVKTKVHGLPRSLIIPLFITMLASISEAENPAFVGNSMSTMAKTRRKFSVLWRNIATRFLTRWAWLPFPEIESTEKIQRVKGER